jgi:hypothetical protein
MNNLPTYNAMPPLSKTHAFAPEDARAEGQPTPTLTIPQMEDHHERQLFTDKAERVVNQVLAFALTVLAVVFVGGLMYKMFVWGH